MENIIPLDSPELKAVAEKFSPFLSEVKKRLIFTIIVFGISTVFGFIFYEQIIKFLIDILGLRGINIVFTSPFQFINLAVACGFASGLILSMPLLTIQILSFLKPALKINEFRMVVRFLPFCLVLFLAGFAFGALMMKWQIDIFLERSISLGIGNVLDISQLLTTVLLTAILMGLAFQFPIILLLLLRIGILKRQQLGKVRPWVYLSSFFFAILLPPDSIIADVFLSMPLIILFELTLILDRVFEARRKKETP